MPRALNKAFDVVFTVALLRHMDAVLTVSYDVYHAKPRSVGWGLWHLVISQHSRNDDVVDTTEPQRRVDSENCSVRSQYNLPKCVLNAEPNGSWFIAIWTHCLKPVPNFSQHWYTLAALEQTGSLSPLDLMAYYRNGSPFQWHWSRVKSGLYRGTFRPSCAISLVEFYWRNVDDILPMLWHGIDDWA